MPEVEPYDTLSRPLNGSDQHIAIVGSGVKIGSAGLESRHGFETEYVGTVCFFTRDADGGNRFVDVDVTKEQLEEMQLQIAAVLKRLQ